MRLGPERSLPASVSVLSSSIQSELSLCSCHIIHVPYRTFTATLLKHNYKGVDRVGILQGDV